MAAQKSPLVDRVRAALADQPVTEQTMFGGVCFMLHGNMLVGASARGLLVRVGKEAYDAALKRPHARPMEMGRPTPGYVVVADEGTARKPQLAGWLDLAIAHVSTLPAKVKAGGKPPAARKAAAKKAE